MRNETGAKWSEIKRKCLGGPKVLTSKEKTEGHGP